MKTKTKKLPVEFKSSPVFYPPIKQKDRARERKWHEHKARRWSSAAGVFAFHSMIARFLTQN